VRLHHHYHSGVWPVRKDGEDFKDGFHALAIDARQAIALDRS
jgi:hypothetical protein